jgi:hypothetical protein
VAYHQSRGREVEVADVSSLGTDHLVVKAHIQSVYDRAQPAVLEHVLLVGTYDVIPIKPKEDVFPWIRSYTWYGMLDGDDYVPDVGVGIIPAKNETELSVVVDKTIRYHKRSTPLSRTTWKRCGLRPIRRMPRCMTRSTATRVPPTRIWRRLSTAVAALSYTTAMVRRTPGSDGVAWASRSPRLQLDELTNHDMHPVVLPASCLNLDMGSGLRSIGEHFVMRETGAVAFAGALQMTGIRYNARRSKRFMAGIWSKDLPSIGEVLIYSKSRRLSAAPFRQRRVMHRGRRLRQRPLRRRRVLRQCLQRRLHGLR